MKMHYAFKNQESNKGRNKYNNGYWWKNCKSKKYIQYQKQIKLTQKSNQTENLTTTRKKNNGESVGSS